ncbi:MAG: LPS-assembly protein LptD, partial [Gammaproteobacteria bacterium]|nr:LPS-assembly protein LptD [Gammaproteobacteria bacterium]
MTALPMTTASVVAAVALLAAPVHAQAVDAATTDWVLDPIAGGLCGGGYAPPALAHSATESIEATGENTVFDGDDRVILVGNAQVARGPFVLKADQISFRNSTGDGDAAGQVSIRQPNAFLTGTQTSVNVRTGSFELSDATFVTHTNQLRGSSRFALGAPNGDIRIIDGRFTFCAPGDETWDLKAADIALNQSSGRGWAEDVTLRVREIPVFYTPILGFPMDDRRLTGFLFPELSSGTNGTELVVPFYWNVAPATDALIQPRYLSDRGTALGLHARHLFKDQTLLDVKTEQLPDDQQTGKARHGSQLALTSRPGQPLVWWVRTENVSDADFADDISNFANLSSDTQLSSQIGATLRRGPWQLGWSADQVDVIDPTVTGTAVRFARQPELQAIYNAPL